MSGVPWRPGFTVGGVLASLYANTPMNTPKAQHTPLDIHGAYAYLGPCNTTAQPAGGAEKSTVGQGALRAIGEECPNGGKPIQKPTSNRKHAGCCADWLGNQTIANDASEQSGETIQRHTGQLKSGVANGSRQEQSQTMNYDAYTSAIMETAVIVELRWKDRVSRQQIQGDLIMLSQGLMVARMKPLISLSAVSFATQSRVHCNQATSN